MSDHRNCRLPGHKTQPVGYGFRAATGCQLGYRNGLGVVKYATKDVRGLGCPLKRAVANDVDISNPAQSQCDFAHPGSSLFRERPGIVVRRVVGALSRAFRDGMTDYQDSHVLFS